MRRDRRRAEGGGLLENRSHPSHSRAPKFQIYRIAYASNLTMINKIAVYGGPRLRTAISTRHTWIRRFPWCGSLRKLHGHCVVTDGVFNSATAGGGVFRAATGIDANTIAQVPAQLRRHLWRSFVRCGLVPGDAAQPMAQWEHDGDFSVDASVCNDAIDGAGCLRLLRYDRRRSPGGIAPSHRSPWNGYANSMTSTSAPTRNRASEAVARGS